MYKTLDYGHVGSFAAELFDNYVNYKLQLSTVRTIIANRDPHEIRVNAVETPVKTFKRLQSILQQEQAKIVEAVRPHLYFRTVVFPH
jgi:hypothetical protein